MTLEESIAAAWTAKDYTPDDEELHGILDRVASVTGVSADRIRSKRRKQPETYARQVAMWHMHRAGFSLPRIGRFFDRDHTTVLHACRRISDKMRRLQ